MIRVFHVEFRVRYKGDSQFETMPFDVVARDGEHAIKKARKLVPNIREWDDVKKHHVQHIAKCWPRLVSLVVETDE